MIKIFYSWQSDLPPRTNRYLIQSALDKACKVIKTEGGILAEAVVERDTLGLPGAPSIADAILSKIRDSDVFVADVSLISHARLNESQQDSCEVCGTSNMKPCPNPNVLTELGYAMSHLGNQALVLVANRFYGPIEALPFDLRSLRVMTYKAAPADTLDEVRKELQRDFEKAIRCVAGIIRGDPVDSILYERTRQVVGQAHSLFIELGRASGVLSQLLTEVDLNKAFDELSEENCLDICCRINPNSTAPLLIDDGAGGRRNAIWLEYMLCWRKRSATSTAQISDFSPFLKREHAALVMRVEHSSYFKQLENLAGPISNNSLEWISSSIWRYFRLAFDLKHYAERELARRAGTF